MCVCVCWLLDDSCQAPDSKAITSVARSGINDIPSWWTWEKFYIEEVAPVAASAPLRVHTAVCSRSCTTDPYGLD